MNLESLTLALELNKTRLALVEAQAKLLGVAAKELRQEGQQIAADLKKAIDEKQAADDAAKAVAETPAPAATE